MRISDWSSDVCSSDLDRRRRYDAARKAPVRLFDRLSLHHVRRAGRRSVGGMNDPRRDDEDLIRKRQRSRSIVMAVLLGALVILMFGFGIVKIRSEERSVGKEGVITGESLGAPYP